MKKFLSVILSFSMLLTVMSGISFNAFADTLAESGTCGPSATYTFDSSTGAMTISGSGKVDYNFCMQNEDVKSLVVNDGIDEIGSRAFSGCYKLETANLDNVKIVGDDAFDSCTYLQTVYLYNATEIGEYAFNGCGLNRIYWNNVEKVGANAFSGNFGLSMIAIPSSLTSIGSGAFACCSVYIDDGSVTIPKTVTYIGGGAFDTWPSITVDSDNPVYDSRDNCNAIIETATNTLVSGSKNSTIPSTVTSIGDYAFVNCENITDLKIPDSVTSIGEHAFYGCWELNSITIPKSVTSIGEYAFSCIDSLKDVYYGGTKSDWNKISIGSDNDELKNATIHYTEKKINITIAKTDLGTVSGDIETNGSKVTKEFTYGDSYTVTAAGDNFLGWEINGKLVSTSASYSSIAYTDVTLVPVFKEAAEGNINVYFYDKYGNLFKTFEGVTAAEYKAALEDGVPQAPAYPGYTFTGYDKSDEEIKANESNAIYTAQYKKAEKTYTVTAQDGAAITVDGKDCGSSASVPYDTKVTVKKDGAQGWSAGGKTIAFGDTYSFYVGSDITLSPLDSAAKKTTVNIIGTTENSPYYSFLATQAGDNIIERGWIYAKDVDDSALADLETANANDAVKVKVTKSNSSEQFSLTIKSSSSGTIKVRAYVADSDGNVYYSDIESVSAQIN